MTIRRASGNCSGRLHSKLRFATVPAMLTQPTNRDFNPPAGIFLPLLPLLLLLPLPLLRLRAQ